MIALDAERVEFARGVCVRGGGGRKVPRHFFAK